MPWMPPSSENPKLAVATAADGRRLLLATKKSPATLIHDVATKVLSTLAGGAVSLLAVHAALAHLPAVVPELASALAIAPAAAKAGLVAVVVAMGAAAGHALTRHKGGEKPAEAPATQKQGFMEAVRNMPWPSAVRFWVAPPWSEPRHWPA